MILRDRERFGQYPRRDKSLYNPERDRILQSKESTTIIKKCVYCEGDHRSAEFQNISSTNERKKILSKKRCVLIVPVKSKGP